jgi:DNA polymerase III sliding clamp (beta) subunit (PCNA family)
VPYVGTPHEEFPAIPNVTHEREHATIPSKIFQEALAKAGKGCSLPVLNCVRISTRKEANGTIKAQLATTDLDTNRVLETKCIDGQFPNTDQVIPQEAPTLSIALGADLINRIAEYALKHGAKAKAITFHFTDALSPARFDVPLEGGRVAKGVLMPMRMS